MLDVDGVLDVHDLHVAAVSSHLVTVTAHVTVSAESDGPSRDRITQRLHKRAINPLRRRRHILADRRHRLSKRLSVIFDTLGSLNQLPRSKTHICAHALNLQIH